jgi:glutaredoxin 3
MASITIYSTPTCGFCHMEKEWLKEKGIAFAPKDITTDETAFNEAIEKAGQPVVPITDIDGTIIIGFDRPKLEAKLKEVGLWK